MGQVFYYPSQLLPYFQAVMFMEGCEGLMLQVDCSIGPVIFRFKKSNFPFLKKLNSVSIPFHYWQR